MTDTKQDWSSSLLKVRRDLITKGPSPLARRALDDLARLMAQPPSGPELTPFHVLYADGGWEGIGNMFHQIVIRALGEIRHIVPVWASHEQEIRLLLAQRQFDCVFLYLNNIIVPQSWKIEERIERVLALIAGLRGRGSATIITLSSWDQFTMEKALHAGADRFFSMPFSVAEVLNLLKERFVSPGGV